MYLQSKSVESTHTILAISSYILSFLFLFYFGRTESRDLACSQTPALLRQQAGCASLPTRLDKADAELVNWLKTSQPEPNLTMSSNVLSVWAKWSTVESYITVPSGSTDDGPSIAFQNPREEQAHPRMT